MTLKIENGTGVSDAQSYVTAEQARSFAATRSVTLASDDSVLDAQLEQAAVLIDSLGPFKTDKQFPGTQRFEWPREGSPSYIPGGVKTAQMLIIFDAIADAGVDFTTLPSLEYKQANRALTPVKEV